MDLSLYPMRYRQRVARLALPAVLALAAGTFSSSLSAQENVKQFYSVKRLLPDSGPDRDEGLQQTILQVSQSFMERETERLEKCFAAKKVFISLRSKQAEAGYYTRSQLHFIFDKIFGDLQTRTFEYSPSDITISEDGRAFFRSEWTYMVLGSDTVVTEHLHFSFEKEKGDWRIFELKSISK
jgi:alpha-ketoglutarate-dependent taurine dioxygenase